MDRGRRDVDGRVWWNILIEGELESFVGSEEGSRRGYGYENNGANALVETLVKSPMWRAIGILVELCIGWRLYPSFQSVKGVDKEVD